MRLIIVLLCFSVPTAWGQAGDALLAPSALSIIERATQANGSAWKRPQTLMLEGRATVYENGLLEKEQTLTPYRMYRVFPTASNAAHSANGKVRFDGYQDGNLIFAISYDGRDSYTQNGVLERNAAAKTWSAAFGFGIIRFADQDGFRVERLADDQVEGNPCYVVRVIDPEGTTTVFAIDRDGLEVRRVGFATPRGWHERIYSDFYWHRQPDFRQPGRVRLYYDGVLTRDILWTKVAVNQPIDDALFQISAAK